VFLRAFRHGRRQPQVAFLFPVAFPLFMIVLMSFFTVIKADRRVARAADAAGPPALSLALPCRRPNNARCSAGAKTRRPGPPGTSDDHRVTVPRVRVLAPAPSCPGRAEPVKGAFGVGFAADS
jgi:hypothetical protein